MVKKKQEHYQKKTITITSEQDKWVTENAINLSRFVQKAIDKVRQKKS